MADKEHANDAASSTDLPAGVSRDDEPQGRGCLLVLYSNNPFYVISASLVLYGIRLAFDPSSAVGIPWILLTLFVGYTCIFAGVAYLVIRWGKVWDDARSILLILVILLLTLSTIFDELVIQNPTFGRGFLAFGLGFSLVLMEWLLHSLKIRIASLYHVSFLAIVTLFFAYPMYLVTLFESRGEWTMAWNVLLFPVLGAMALLPLVPAIQRGDAYVRNNGTPWRFPLFPCSLFVILTVCLGFRSYLLTMSFDPRLGMNTIFCLCFLAPLALVGILLLFEIEMLFRIDHAPMLSLLLPIPLLGTLLLFPPFEPAGMLFLHKVTTTFASPTHLCLWGVVLFYAWTWWRGCRAGEVGLCGSVALLAFCDPSAIHFFDLWPSDWVPLAFVACLQLAVSWYHPRSLRFSAAALSGVVSASIASRSTWFVAQDGFAAWNLLLALLLIIGLRTRDQHARFTQTFAAFLVVGLTLYSLQRYNSDSGDFAFRFTSIYICLLGLTCLAYGIWTWNRYFTWIGFVNLGISSSLSGLRLWRWLLLLHWPRGALSIGLGFILLALAGIISGIKGAFRESENDATDGISSRLPME